MEVEKTKREGLMISGKAGRFGLDDEKDFLEITKWDNAEGWTISIGTSLGVRTFELSWEELEGIKYLINRLENE